MLDNKYTMKVILAKKKSQLKKTEHDYLEITKKECYEIKYVSHDADEIRDYKDPRC